jgi:Domain of Unknown Function (DUF1259)
MKRQVVVLAGTVWLLIVMVVGWGVVRAADTALDTAKIEQLTGGKGELNAQEGVFKVSVPRTDLAVTAAGVKMTPPMGLTSWAAFQPVSPQTMVMGDIVLLEDQVNPVMSVALSNGLEVTALHNHSLDPKHIEEILGVKGQMANGVYKVTIGRATNMHGHDVGNTMGVNTWAAFVGSDDTAVVDGDFAMLESELQPVLKALRGAGINIVAIHQHMTMESPRVMFLHYWGVGPTRALATGLKAALATQQH